MSNLELQRELCRKDRTSSEVYELALQYEQGSKFQRNLSQAPSSSNSYSGAYNNNYNNNFIVKREPGVNNVNMNQRNRDKQTNRQKSS